MNRLGDLGFLVGTVLIFYLFRSVDFSTVFALAPLFENTTVLLGGFEVQFVAAACF
jgi:NADH:ubiquinone oxidoreductase subunit 5 (subunit L)/multisubunit Na+/H+ antiporter MnhA subunit